MSKGSRTVTVAGTTVKLTSQDKVLFPGEGITKGDLADYYQRIAPWMLPYLKDRPLTLHRYPEGITGEAFLQKSTADYFPEYIKRVLVQKAGGTLEMALADEPADLMFLANLGTITFHPWLSRVDKPDVPDKLIIDLDPPAPEEFELARTAALALKELLEELGLAPFPMTTGSKGVHVVVPVDRKAPFEEMGNFAEAVCAVIAARNKDKYTTQFYKTGRKGRLFLDTRRNAYAQTAVAPYSVRARAGAPVATPLDWEELKDRKLRSNRYTIATVFDKLERDGDPWKGWTRKAKGLATAWKKLEALG
ncbi:MAG TPA: non-homologous end-joining DNA ligase [bacterium]|nr:non-homologous end-joining DNA ligase [bacterium]